MREPMKPREWIFIIFIVILLQFIVQVAAWLYGGNTGALGYVSFAGTVVSIILAVLAIVYSNFQSISQQSSADRISGQVERLIGVTGNIETGKKSLVSTISHLNNLAQKLDESIANQGNINQKVDGIVKKFERSMSKSSISSKDSLSVDGQNMSMGDFNAPFTHGYLAQITQSIFFYYGAKLGLSLTAVSDELVQPILRGIVKDGDSAFDAYNDGMQVISWQFFITHGYLVFVDEQENDYDRKFSLHEDFEESCLKFIEYLKGLSKDVRDSSDEMLLRIVEVCESKLVND